ncbi:pyridoxamine 5'-phosphate oxidase family protein [Natronomonas sp. CBA1123]|uniref:pyridoxamine 5'-phosphate oxidase family protein n=1 Tax=Natronomonas sp. CBA1123 TaxID=2668070 RepID=UPI0012EA71B5|nr:pyridoxamine 5'-phosphate oxidase family protein [Natronomonas sp. CBA1123]MUV86196.1 pyridoxamine 5'-phosphate oxidase family protein [Natronomonas sp. CBA1123]
MTQKMSQSGIDALLSAEGAGVLSLTDGAETYAIPESFGYDGTHLYFQFAHEDDSRKMAFLETTDVATFTVFTTEPAESVQARGRIEAVPHADHDAAAAALADNATVPTMNVIPDTPVEDLSMAFYRLVADSLSGRVFDDPMKNPTEA